MAQCLVTKLKESVTDESMLKLAEMRLTYDDDLLQTGNSNSDCLVIHSQSAQQASVLKGGPFMPNSVLGTSPSYTAQLDNGSGNWLCAQAGTVISIPDKYSIDRLFAATEKVEVTSAHAEWLSESLYHFVAWKYTGTIDVFARYTQGLRLTLRNTNSPDNITGSVESLKGVIAINIGDTSAITDIGGDIGKIGFVKSSLYSFTVALFGRYLSGTLESMVKNIVQAGFTSLESANINVWNGSAVTLNAKSLPTSVLRLTVNGTTARVHNLSDTATYATYNIAADKWTYPA